MKTRPPNTAACDRTEVTLPRANAHFNLSRATLEAVSPLPAAAANRAFSGPAPHPFQEGAPSGSHRSEEQRVGFGAAPASRAPRYSAICLRSSAVNLAACARIAPDSRDFRIAGAG